MLDTVCISKVTQDTQRETFSWILLLRISAQPKVILSLTQCLSRGGQKPKC